MLADKNIGFTSSLISEPSRAAILMALLDGRALPASELAYRAGISPQTASSHLSKLVEGKLIVVEQHGRHRYYKLAGPEIGQALETLLAIAPQTPLLRKVLADEQSAIRVARTCYDHLAGRLGVHLTLALVKKKVIAPDDSHYTVTKKGEKWFAEFGVEIDRLKQIRRIFAKQCLDWTERQPHLAGVLGAAILNRLLEQKWIVRAKEDRSVHVTVQGKEMLPKTFGVKV
ncbi:MAG: ArsR/SmtB family transcription factor [Blastocatellia bacterium]